MVRTTLRVVGLAVGVLATTPVFAQQVEAASSSPPPTASAIWNPPDDHDMLLTLGATVTRARRDPPSVLQAIATARNLEAQVPLTRTALLPTVTGTLSVSGQAQSGPSNYVPGTNVVAESGQFGAGITGRWTVWDFGRTSLNVRAGEENARGARRDVTSAEHAAIAQAVAAYYTVLADQALVASLRETARQRERELAITRGLVEAGTHNPVEQTRAQLTLANAQLDVTNAETTRLTDLSSLAAALALDPARTVAVAQPHPFTVDDDPSRAADTAERSRPEIRAARERLAAAQTNVMAARAQYRPSITVTGNANAGALQYVATAMTPGLGGFQASTSVSAGLTVPIYDPTIVQDIRIAETNVASMRATLAAQVLAVRTDAAQAAIAVRAAEQALVQAEQAAALAAADLQQAEGRYAAGVAPLLELVDAQSGDATARVAVVRARFQWQLAIARVMVSTERWPELESAQ